MVNITISEYLNKINPDKNHKVPNMVKVQKCQVTVFKRKKGVYELRLPIGNFSEEDFKTEKYERALKDEKCIEIELSDFGGKDNMTVIKAEDNELKFSPILKNPSHEIKEILESEKVLILHKVYENIEGGILKRLLIEKLY